MLKISLQVINVKLKFFLARHDALIEYKGEWYILSLCLVEEVQCIGYVIRVEAFLLQLMLLHLKGFCQQKTRKKLSYYVLEKVYIMQ